MSLLLAAFTGCTSGPARPSDWTGPFDVPSVLARAVAAAGGEAALAPPATVHTRSRVVLYPGNGAPIDGTLEYFAQEPDLERRELVTAGGHSLIRVLAHGRMLELEDGRPTGIDRSRDAARLRRYRRLLAALREEGPEPARLVADPGADPDRSVVLERRLAPDERWQAWIDARSGLVTRIRCLHREKDGEHVDEDFLSGHERFGDRVLPRHAVTWQDGRRVKEAWLTDYEEGEPLDPALFAIDGG